LNGQPSTRAATRTAEGASIASSTAPIAPVRSKVAPVRTSRQMLCGPFTSDLPARMQRRDPEAEVAIGHALEAGVRIMLAKVS
jgi:hypothetical protein